MSPHQSSVYWNPVGYVTKMSRYRTAKYSTQRGGAKYRWGRGRTAMAQSEPTNQNDVNWWGIWGPWVFSNPQPTEHKGVMPTRKYVHRGSDQLSHESMSVLGTRIMPSCDHAWRQMGHIPHVDVQLYQWVPQEYSPDALTQLAVKGDMMVKKLGMYPALCSIQESVARRMNHQLELPRQQCDTIPDQYPWIEQTSTKCASAEYKGGIPCVPRTRCLPYQTGNAEHCQYIARNYGKTRSVKTSSCAPLIVLRIRHPWGPLRQRPSRKKTDRTISTDRRVIADLRLANIHFETDQYYPARVPTSADVIRMITQVHTQWHGSPASLNKRDVASAFRLLKLRPTLSLRMVSELPGKFFGSKHDVVMFYRPMPFGWNGSPSFLAVFAGAITRIHRTSGTGRPLWNFGHAFTPCLYVDEGIFIELPIARRQEGTIRRWGKPQLILWGTLR